MSYDNHYNKPPDCIQIRGNRIVYRTAWEEMPRNRSEKQKAATKHLRNNIPAGFINRKIRSNIDRIVTNWITAIRLEAEDRNKKVDQLITFITLTLPSKQQHEDKELYRLCLMPFIQYLKRKFNAEHYVWRAERQQNGNLHYHLITDKYVPWTNIRAKWNDLLKPLGYIDAYESGQRAWHSKGFKPRPEQFDTWSMQNQLKAYEYGVKTGWRDPNSTDIHRLNKVDNVAGYITKYMAKGCEEMRELEALNNTFKDGDISESTYNEHKDTIIAAMQKYKINGRVWGCSDSLKEVKDTKIIADTDVYLLLDKVVKDTTTKQVEMDTCTLFYCKNIRKYIEQFPTIKTEYREHYRNLYDQLYRPFKPDLFTSAIISQDKSKTAYSDLPDVRTCSLIELFG